MRVVWRLGSVVLGILFCGACEPVKQDYAAYPSLDVSPLPEATPPPLGPLQEAAQVLEAGQPKQAIRQLSAFRSETSLEQAWHRLLLGQAYFEIGAHEKALRLFLANYEELRDARPAPETERSRVLARSLKKLGAYYRDQRDYERAYTMHQLQWLYMRRLGTRAERFDALISLDIDAAHLRNYFASEQWLREALLVAQEMPEGLERQRSLIHVWRSVALSLSELLRFQEAESAARESRRLSQLYDPASGGKEFLEVGAIAQQAEVYGAWARFTEAKNPAEAKPLYEKAQALAIEALTRADEQGLTGTERGSLEQSMRRYCGASCRP